MGTCDYYRFLTGYLRWILLGCFCASIFRLSRRFNNDLFLSQHDHKCDYESIMVVLYLVGDGGTIFSHHGHKCDYTSIVY
jgi:hypothetical protein